jgi:hypothetical protein
MRCRSGGWGGAALLVGALALSTSASACGTNDSAPVPTVAHTPAQAIRFYNRAIASGDYASACALLTGLGRVNALHDGRELAKPGHAHPTTCAAALKVVVPDTPENRKLGRGRVIRVRPNPRRHSELLVTERFANGMLQDVLVTRQRGRWLLVLNPYSPLA